MPPDKETPGIVARYPSATTDELVAKHAQDVSESGILLRASSTLPIGKLVHFEIELSNGEVVLTGAGRIAWRRDAPDGERPAGVGVKFLDLDEVSQGLVDRLLAAKKEVVSEFERPPAAEGAAKTVLGLGSPFELAPAGEKARVGTRLGLAPPIVPATLVLGEQSSPSVEPLASPRPQSTSDIDKGWLDEAKTGKRQVAPALAEAPSEAKTPLAPAIEKPLDRQVPPIEPAKVSRATPEPAPAFEATEAPAGVPRRRTWWWVVLLVIATVVGVYRFRDSLHRAGLAPAIPTIPGLPGWLSEDEPAPPAPEVTSPLPSATSASSPPSAVPVASAPSVAPPTSAIPVASASPSAGSGAAPTRSAASALASASPDAGKSPPPAKSAASAKNAHTAPSASAAAKPHSPPKPKSADDNPY
jgi:Tfp pilus assembly protein PilZ